MFTSFSKGKIPPLGFKTMSFGVFACIVLSFIRFLHASFLCGFPLLPFSKVPWFHFLEFSWSISRWTYRNDWTFFAASKKALHIIDLAISLVSSRYLKIWSHMSFGNIYDPPTPQHTHTHTFTISQYGIISHLFHLNDLHFHDDHEEASKAFC